MLYIYIEREGGWEENKVNERTEREKEKGMKISHVPCCSLFLFFLKFKKECHFNILKK